MLSRALPLASALILALLFCAGCAEHQGVPSLQPRAIERLSAADADVVTAPPPIPANTPLSQKLVMLIDQARTADAAFKAATPTAETSAANARSAGSGSEAWVVAQQALTRLDVTRGPVRDALAEIETMQINEAYTSGNAAFVSALGDAIESVAALDDAETEQLSSLRSGLTGP